MSHSHHHHDEAFEHGQSVHPARLIFVMVLNLFITLAQVVGGLISGSLALISDALHNLSDTAAVFLSYVSVKISQKPKTHRKSFGYQRANILSAFINSAALVGVTIYLIIEAVRRLMQPTPIAGWTVVWVALIGLMGNALSVILLRKGAKHSLNIKSSYLHLLGDALTSVAVLFCGIVMQVYKVYWLDPVLTILINVVIIRSAYGIIKECMHILMQGTPTHIELEHLIQDLKKMSEVIDVHHLHIWQLDDRHTMFEGHIVIQDRMISQTHDLRDNIDQLLKDHFGILHSSIIFEECHCGDEECNL